MTAILETSQDFTKSLPHMSTTTTGSSLEKNNKEYDQEIPQSHTAYQPTARRWEEP